MNPTTGPVSAGGCSHQGIPPGYMTASRSMVTMGNSSMLLRRRAMDPRWPWHQRSVPIGHMGIVCEIFRRSGDVNDYGWDINTGGLTLTDPDGTPSRPHMALLYRGQTRAVSNKDWRARVRASRGDSGISHAMRFQVPIRECPPIHAHDVLRVLECPPDMELVHYIFHVRNPLMSSNTWVRNLLCDVDVAHPQLLPPPYEALIADARDIPQPVSNCGCG